MADESAYEQAIEILTNYRRNIAESCTAMKQAAKDCVDNMDGDDAAKVMSAKVLKHTSNILDAAQEISGIIKGLQAELEKIRQMKTSLNSED